MARLISQRAAVEAVEGPLLILAGAGSGKNRVILHRVAYLVGGCGVSPRQIMAVTFTNKAAREMRERLVKRLGERSKALRICTFHALDLEMIRRHAEHVGRGPNLSVFAETEQVASLRSVLQDMALPADAEQVKLMLRRISAAKSGMGTMDAGVNAVRERFDALLMRMNAVDFDDLLVLPIRLLSEHDDIRDYWRERARHFLVEVLGQHVDVLLVLGAVGPQLELRQHLVGERHAHDEAGMAGGVAEIHQPPLRQHDDALAAGELHLGEVVHLHHGQAHMR